MHELALAEAVLRTAEALATKDGFHRVSKVIVRLGALQSIRPATFEHCLTQLSADAGAGLAEAEFALETDAAAFVCRRCDRRFGLFETPALDDDEKEAVHFLPELVHAFVRCPDCNSADYDVVAGRGVTIAAIEGVR